MSYQRIDQRLTRRLTHRSINGSTQRLTPLRGSSSSRSSTQNLRASPKPWGKNPPLPLLLPLNLQNPLNAPISHVNGPPRQYPSKRRQENEIDARIAPARL